MSEHLEVSRDMFSEKNFFKKGIIFCLVVWGFVFFPCSLAAKKPLLELNLAVEERQYVIDDDIRVVVVVRNTSSQLVSTYVGLAFTLRSKDLHIWAPVVFDAEPREIKRGETMLLRLEPFEEKTFEYNLAKVRWDSAYSSVWPTRPFGTVIIPGEYALMFEIRKKMGDDVDRFESNVLSITVLPKVSPSKSKFIVGEEAVEIMQ